MPNENIGQTNMSHLTRTTMIHGLLFIIITVWAAFVTSMRAVAL